MRKSKIVSIKWFSITFLAFIFTTNLVLFIALNFGSLQRLCFSNILSQQYASIESVNFDGEFHDKPNELLYMKNFQHLKTKPKCSEDDNFLFIILVHSGVFHSDRRKAVRDTWGHSDPRTKTYFVLGASDSATLQKKVDEEDAKYNDIIQGNFVDTYHNLSYKHTLVLKWFNENCPKVTYLVKVDVFVNIPAVHEYLLRMPYNPNFLMGMYWKPARTMRHGKYKVTREEMAENHSPEFTLGHSIIYADQVARRFYRRAPTTHFIFIDDLFITGYVRMQFNIGITPISEYKLWDEMVERTINGSVPLREPMFLFSADATTGDRMLGLWKLLEPYRQRQNALN